MGRFLFLICSRFSPIMDSDAQGHSANKPRDRWPRKRWARRWGRNMNATGEIAVTLAGMIGFGRLFLADEGASHRLSGFLILAGLVGKVALSI